jgi:hypothetical protein
LIAVVRTARVSLAVCAIESLDQGVLSVREVFDAVVTSFTLPYVTIENVLLLNPHTLLVANDNNFPYGGGRALASDHTEFLRIALPNGRGQGHGRGR